MVKRKTGISRVRGTLYKTARALGDLEVLSRGPEACVKRVARRTLGKIAGRMLGKLFR